MNGSMVGWMDGWLNGRMEPSTTCCRVFDVTNDPLASHSSETRNSNYSSCISSINHRVNIWQTSLWSLAAYTSFRQQRGLISAALGVFLLPVMLRMWLIPPTAATDTQTSHSVQSHLPPSAQRLFTLDQQEERGIRRSSLLSRKWLHGKAGRTRPSSPPALSPLINQ